MRAREEGQSGDFEFEVALVATLRTRGTFAAGWIRRGQVRVGDRVLVLGEGTPIATIVRGVGTLSGHGPRTGGPNIELLLDGPEATSRLAPGVRIVTAPSNER